MRIKNFCLFIFLIVTVSVTFLSAEVKTMKGLNLMPVPMKVINNDGKFRLSDSFKVAVKGQAEDRLYNGVTRTLRRLSKRTGLFFPQDVITAKSKIDTANFIITCQRPGKVVLHEDESYHLVVSSEKIELTTETDIGALRGLETFRQLVEADSVSYFLPAVTIEDKPRFPWRGLLIDACRHFMPVDVIKRNLDGMAAVKMNVLHWHLTEDQGWRIEIKPYPRLTKVGAMRKGTTRGLIGKHDGVPHGGFYTQEEIREIVPFRTPDDVEVKNMKGARSEFRAFHLGNLPEKSVVLKGVPITGSVPVLDVPELDGQYGRLDRVQAAVDAFNLMNVFLERSVICEKAGDPGKIIVVCDDGSPVPVGPQILPRIETERPGYSEGPGSCSFDCGKMGLGAVLDEMEVVVFADLPDGPDISRLPEKVDGNDCLGLFSNLFLDLRRIDVEVLVDIHKNGPRPGLGDRFRG